MIFTNSIRYEVKMNEPKTTKRIREIKSGEWNKIKSLNIPWETKTKLIKYYC